MESFDYNLYNHTMEHYPNYEVESDYESEGPRVEPAMVFHAVVMSVAGVIGIGSNIILVFLIASRQELRSVTNLYILSRSVFDLLNQVMMPLQLITIAQRSFIFGENMCKLTSFVLQATTVSSTYILVFIAIDCYLNSQPNPKSSSYRYTVFKVLISILGVVCILLAILSYFLIEYLHIEYEDDIVYICIDGPLFTNQAEVIAILSNAIILTVPLILMWVYVSLPFRATSTTTEVSPPPSHAVLTEEEQPQSLKQSSRFLMALVTLWTLCHVPYWMVHLLLMMLTPSGFTVMFYVIVSLLDVNMCISPILCLLLKKDLQHNFKGLFSRKHSSSSVNMNLM